MKSTEGILQDWENYAQSLFPATVISERLLRNHAKDILETIATDISRSQTLQTQEDKSKGLTPDNSPALETAGEQHALARVKEHFDLNQLIGEFRALRRSVLRRWAAQKMGEVGHPHEITRFNESVDEALASSVRHYSQKLDEARTVIIGIFAHDLRNPLHAILMGASYIIRNATETSKCIQTAARIKISVSRSEQLVSDLLDYARSKLGQGMPVTPNAANMQALCSGTIDELELVNPGRVIIRHYSGPLNGVWDSARISQLIGNWLSNALKHGRVDSPVSLTAASENDKVSVEVHNDGPCIPGDALDSLFEPLYLKGGVPGQQSEGSSGLGLGLFICREIVLAHGGGIEVKSNPQFGTSLKFTLPRESQRK